MTQNSLAYLISVSRTSQKISRVIFPLQIKKQLHHDIFLSCFCREENRVSRTKKKNEKKWLWIDMDYFMVGERVRFLFTSCEESQTNE